MEENKPKAPGWIRALAPFVIVAAIVGGLVYSSWRLGYYAGREAESRDYPESVAGKLDALDSRVERDENRYSNEMAKFEGRVYDDEEACPWVKSERERQYWARYRWLRERETAESEIRDGR